MSIHSCIQLFFIPLFSFLVKSSTRLWLKIFESLMGSNHALKSRLWHETHYHGNDNWKICHLKMTINSFIKEPWLHNVYWKALAMWHYTCWPWGFGSSILLARLFPCIKIVWQAFLLVRWALCFFNALYAFCTPKCMLASFSWLGDDGPTLTSKSYHNFMKPFYFFKCYKFCSQNKMLLNKILIKYLICFPPSSKDVVNNLQGWVITYNKLYPKRFLVKVLHATTSGFLGSHIGSLVSYFCHSLNKWFTKIELHLSPWEEAYLHFVHKKTIICSHHFDLETRYKKPSFTNLKLQMWSISKH